MSKHIHIHFLPRKTRDQAPGSVPGAAKPAKHPPAHVNMLVAALMQAIKDRQGQGTTQDAGFDESKHKRDASGKFTAGATYHLSHKVGRAISAKFIGHKDGFNHFQEANGTIHGFRPGQNEDIHETPEAADAARKAERARRKKADQAEGQKKQEELDNEGPSGGERHLITSHSAIAKKHGLNIHNFGWAMTGTGIASKTDGGVLESEVDPKTGHVVHSIDDMVLGKTKIPTRHLKDFKTHDAGEWDESKHPRAEGGKFTSGQHAAAAKNHQDAADAHAASAGAAEAAGNMKLADMHAKASEEHQNAADMHAKANSHLAAGTGLAGHYVQQAHNRSFSAAKHSAATSQLEAGSGNTMGAAFTKLKQVASDPSQPVAKRAAAVKHLNEIEKQADALASSPHAAAAPQMSAQGQEMGPNMKSALNTDIYPHPKGLPGSVPPGTVHPALAAVTKPGMPVPGSAASPKGDINQVTGQPLTDFQWKQQMKAGVGVGVPKPQDPANAKPPIKNFEFEGAKQPPSASSAPSNAPATGKPTSSTAKGKAGVHELLSTGHPFSVDELMAATGVTNKSTLMTALSDLKSPKYAGKLGALSIVKRPDGMYHVQKGDAALPAAHEMSASVAKLGGGAATPEASSMGHFDQWKADVKKHHPNAEYVKNAKEGKLHAWVGTNNVGSYHFQAGLKNAMAWHKTSTGESKYSTAPTNSFVAPSTPKSNSMSSLGNKANAPLPPTAAPAAAPASSIPSSFWKNAYKKLGQNAATKSSTKPSGSPKPVAAPKHPGQAAITAAHIKEAKSRGVDIGNLGAGVTDNGIFSKTSHGGFESEWNPKTGKIEHNWHEDDVPPKLWPASQHKVATLSEDYGGGKVKVIGGDPGGMVYVQHEDGDTSWVNEDNGDLEYDPKPAAAAKSNSMSSLGNKAAVMKAHEGWKEAGHGGDDAAASKAWDYMKDKKAVDPLKLADHSGLSVGHAMHLRKAHLEYMKANGPSKPLSKAQQIDNYLKQKWIGPIKK